MKEVDHWDDLIQMIKAALLIAFLVWLSFVIADAKSEPFDWNQFYQEQQAKQDRMNAQIQQMLDRQRAEQRHKELLQRLEETTLEYWLEHRYD